MSPTRWFFKNSVKIGENQENSVETHWRQTVKPETPINWAVFQKIGGRFLSSLCRKPTDFCEKLVNGTKKP
jgi:hypothetical protein